MKTRGSTPDATALLFSFVETLQKRLEDDEVLKAACWKLHSLGLSPLVRVELLASADPARVVCADRRVAVPEWSVRDVEILHSAGIASEPSNDADPGAPQPRRRQPR
ncbi:MAG TPA: hypothetical protein VMT19_08515 [Thermoanaerobaculaceae bacterium]|nr:hypothetical protein [Thermoanaerobaculaceae bacterium]